MEDVPMTQINKNHPMMIAWVKYKGSDEYENSRKWAKYEEHRDGSLWAAFVKGWESNGQKN